MIIDGKEYISIEEHKKVVEELKENYKKNTGFLGDLPLLCDDAKIMAIGSVNNCNDFIFTSISISFLKKAIKIVEEVNCYDEKNKKREHIHLGIRKDFPLLLGELNKDTHKFAGVIISPRVMGVE